MWNVSDGAFKVKAPVTQLNLFIKQLASELAKQ